MRWGYGYMVEVLWCVCFSYKDILKSHTPASSRKWKLVRRWILQQDTHPNHVSKSTRTCLTTGPQWKPEGLTRPQTRRSLSAGLAQHFSWCWNAQQQLPLGYFFWLNTFPLNKYTWNVLIDQSHVMLLYHKCHFPLTLLLVFTRGANTFGRHCIRI